MAQLYLRWRGEVSGPFAEEDLKGMLKDARISKHHQVSSDRKSWMPIQEFSSFRGDCIMRPSAERMKVRPLVAVAVPVAQPVNKAAPQVIQAIASPLTPGNVGVSVSDGNESADVQRPSHRPGTVATRWFYATDNKVEGPVTEAQIRALVASGSLTGDTHLCQEGRSSWIEAHKVLGDLEPLPLPPVTVTSRNGEETSYRDERRPQSYRESGSNGDNSNTGLVVGGWFAAFLMPFVGVIFGIVLLVKGNRIGNGVGILIVSLMMFGFWAAFLQAFSAAVSR